MKVPKFDKHMKKAGGYKHRNVVEITIKIKTIVQKPLMIRIQYFLTNQELLYYPHEGLQTEPNSDKIEIYLCYG